MGHSRHHSRIVQLLVELFADISAEWLKEINASESGEAWLADLPQMK